MSLNRCIWEKLCWNFRRWLAWLCVVALATGVHVFVVEFAFASDRVSEASPQEQVVVSQSNLLGDFASHPNCPDSQKGSQNRDWTELLFPIGYLSALAACACFGWRLAGWASGFDG